MKKLLIVSDAPTGTSGFGRITRDLATRIREHLGDKIEVATAGYGPPASKSLPFWHYSISDPVPNGWQIPELPEIYNDLCDEGEELIIFFIWDLSRLLWAADPTFCTIPQLQTFMKDAPIKKWVYVPIDAQGVDGKLSHVLAYAASRFDKVLAYTKFGSDILERTFTDKKFEHIPHGIDGEVFYPRGYKESKESLGTKVFNRNLKNSTVIGAVATNQKRKDFSLVFRTVKELLNRGFDPYLWLNTDVISRYWDVNTLVTDLGLKNRVAVTMGLTNEELCTYYSGCTATIAPGRGEGLGFPIFESIFCGTPCFHGNYGGAPEFILDKDHLVEPVAFQDEDSYLSKRPVLRAEDFCDKIQSVLGIRRDTKWNPRLEWEILWKNEWEPWFLRNING